MDTSPRPTLRDWIIARHAAGLPIVSAHPRAPRHGLNIRGERGWKRRKTANRKLNRSVEHRA